MSNPLHLDARTTGTPTGPARKRPARRAPEPPTAAEAEQRLATYAAAPRSPWLAPEALEAAKDLPELVGPMDGTPRGRKRPGGA